MKEVYAQQMGVVWSIYDKFDNLVVSGLSDYQTVMQYCQEHGLHLYFDSE